MRSGSRRRARRYVETRDFLAMVARLLSRAGERVADADVEDLRDLLQLQHLVDEALLQAVAGLRESGVTWQQIGDVSGTTRQAALMRWGPKIDAA
jgi:hypothetical protein